MHFIPGCILQQRLRSGLESTHRAGANGAGPSNITSPLGKHSKQKAKQKVRRNGAMRSDRYAVAELNLEFQVTFESQRQAYFSRQ